MSNVVAANLLAIEVDGVSGEVFNLACGESLNLNEVVTQIAGDLKVQPNVIHGPSRVSDVPHSLADIGRARERLNYESLVPARKGISHAVASFRVRN